MDKKGQSTLEVVVLLVIFVMAILCMRSYFRRSLQANLRSSIDSFSDEQFDLTLSNETVSDLNFARTNVTSDITGETNLLDIADDGDGVKKVPNWGTYDEQVPD